jgi:hypothetical protein
MKSPRCDLVGNRWLIENQEEGVILGISPTSSQSVSIQDSAGARIDVLTKCVSITLLNCSRVTVNLTDVISQVEVISSKKTTLNITGTVPLVSISMSNGCQMIFPHKASVQGSHATQVAHHLSTEMTIAVPDLEYHVPDQFITSINSLGEIHTAPVKHV